MDRVVNNKRTARGPDVPWLLRFPMKTNGGASGAAGRRGEGSGLVDPNRLPADRRPDGRLPLLDVLFVQAIRTWAASDGKMPEGWLAGLTHRQLAQTLQRIHADLAHPWTLGQLARDAAMSRSSFAALLKAVVGAPPLTYITTWRIYRAKLMLAAGHSIAEAAGQTGYGSDLALSRAFKTATGLSPGQWRRECRAAGRNGPGPVKSAALGSSVTKAVERGQHGRTRPPAVHEIAPVSSTDRASGANSSGPRASS
jgi:AraC-like DNA-binding protein